MIAVASDIQFAVADESHDPGMRRLLREVPTPGSIRVSLQREPSYFGAAKMEGPEHHAIVALAGAEVVGMGSISTRHRFVNGVPACVGYLGGLRLAPSVQGRFDIIRRGYAFLRQHCDRIGLESIFTSIAADNERASRLLERGVPGLPTYAPAGELATLLLRVTRRNIRPPNIADQTCPATQIECVNASMRQFQFAPCWDGSECADREFVIVKDREHIGACAALWDQRQFKQAVVTHYPIHLRLLAMMGRLPAIGRPLSQAFVSHLVCPAARPDLLIQLIDRLASRASHANIDMLCIGMDIRDARLKVLQRRYSTRIYRTRLYRVAWEDEGNPHPPLDGRLVYPEVALL